MPVFLFFHYVLTLIKTNSHTETLAEVAIFTIIFQDFSGYTLRMTASGDVRLLC